MREVSLAEGRDEILKCFQNTDVILYLWQDNGDTSSRVIYPSKVQTLSDNTVLFGTHDYSDYDLFPGKIFCFNEDLKYFFKLDQIQMQSNTLEVKIPENIKILSEKENLAMSEALYEIFKKAQDSSNYISENTEDHMTYLGPRENIDLGVMKIKGAVGSKNRNENDQAMFDEIIGSAALSEEDKLFADKRDAPRARPTQGKVVFIKTSTDEDSFDLYDLSMGGMSVITSKVASFSEQEEVCVLGFDDKRFEEPLKAIVRSVRDIEDLLGQYKVGLQFLEE